MDISAAKVTKIETRRPVVRNNRIEFETEVQIFNNDQETTEEK